MLCSLVDGPVKKIDEAIISIRPNYAKSIVAGTKTVELRRRIPPLDIGARLWIYATRPVAAVIAYVMVDNFFKGSPDTAWKNYSDRAGISREDFDHYFDGAAEAVVIELVGVRPVSPVGIEQLRHWKEGFHPPQVLSKITSTDAERLWNISSENAIKTPAFCHS
jgi:predicted transcriptional regulator